MTINIVGAGMAGLLAANMLRHRDPVVWEIQPSLPNNHSAVLRFRSSAVGDVLNIPFKKVQMIKDHIPWRNAVADALAYSFKNNGEYRSDRSIIAGQTVAERWIAPPDLISRMAERLEIRYGKSFDFKISNYGANDPIISTLPMPILMKELEFKDASSIRFNSISGLNVKATISNCDAYISLLIPNPNIPFSRVSITGNEMIVEVAKNPDNLDHEEIAVRAADLLGLKYDFYDVRSYPQKYAKITPIDEDRRKEFQHWATVNHNVYSLGRFATWRPNILLDDLVKDIRKIDNWIGKTSKYDVARDR